jgi:RHS repeat-associated protein
MQSLFQIEIIYKPAKDETIVFSRSIPIPQKGSDPLNQTKLLFPLIFISREDDSSIVIPPQPTRPSEIMSGGEGEPVEADVPAKDETVSPQGTHVTGTQTVTHEYLTLSGKIARETIKTNDSLTAVLDFIYDESGKPFALKYSTNGTNFQTYYYVLNLQGDVVKLIQSNGYVAAQYTYDAWGNILDSGGDLAAVNPLRYRGYYYDNETGFYYLQSRYYDPANRRFINADGLISSN